MTLPGRPARRHSDALVVAALLKLGSDTRAARLFKTEVQATLSAWDDVIGAPERLLDALGLPPGERLDRLAKARIQAAEAVDRANHLQLGLLTALDDQYPELARHIPDPPIVLWHSGPPDRLNRPAVAVVGSRRATPEGRATARRLGRDLAKAGLVVVSGLARGIDAEAHIGALEGGGMTVAVLGNGPDVVYPREHAGLARQIVATGTLVSEYPPGTRPLPGHFPLRNRLISGLSRAVLVVEASERSGSLITARMALEQGRDVLAVPGNVVSGCHRGCHALIKDGARLVENVEDILEEIGWLRPDSSLTHHENSLSTSGLTAEMHPGEAVSIDDLALRTGLPAHRLLEELSRLELEGRIARMGGGTFVRLD